MILHKKEKINLHVKIVDKNVSLFETKNMKKIFLNLKAFLQSLNSQTPEKLSKILLREAFQISSAESCTGGLVSSRLTDISGSSAYIKANFVTYSNEAKHRILNVSESTLEKYGAVSEECAKEMAQGLLQLTQSDIVICTTGVAGPTGSERKPVGLMYAACGFNNKISVKKFELNPNYSRKNMKFMFSEKALEFVLETIQQ